MSKTAKKPPKKKDKPPEVKPGTGGEASLAPPAPEPESTLTEDDVLNILTELFCQHGTNVLNRGNRYATMAKLGLRPSQLSSQLITKAKDLCAQRINDKAARPVVRNESELLWDLTPKEEQWNCGGVALVFESLCGRYRAYCITPLKAEFPHFCAQYRQPPGVDPQWQLIEFSERKGEGYAAKRHRAMEATLMAVEKFHRDRSGCVRLETNRQDVLRVLQARYHKEVEEAKEAQQQAQANAENADKPAKERKPRAPSTPGVRGPRSTGQALFGHALTKAIRGMGALGFNYADVRKVLAHYGLRASDSTVKTQLYMSRDAAKYGAGATFTEAQKKEILALK